MEIACDESGYEGEKLVGGVTDVFAHASVRLSEDQAVACIGELRERIRSPATEYKANHVLRSKHRPVLLWLLGASGPLQGNAQVQLVDKAFFLVSRLTELVGGQDASGLYAAGRSTGGTAWAEFLMAANDLLRVRELPGVVDTFYRSVDQLPLDKEVLAPLRRPYGEVARATVFDDAQVVPPLDPLVPAIARAVEYWSDGEPVVIAHDRQTTLSPERIAWLQLDERLAGLELVHSFSNPRVQVADFLAGVARKIASDQLRGEDDAELTTLIRPYLDPLSVWADAASWARLSPAPCLGRRIDRGEQLPS